MVKVKYSSIVNLIGNKEVVPEFLQNKMKPENIKNKLVELLNEKSKLRNQMLDDFINDKVNRFDEFKDPLTHENFI